MRQVIRHYPDNSYLYKCDGFGFNPDNPFSPPKWEFILHSKGRDIGCWRIKVIKWI